MAKEITAMNYPLNLVQGETYTNQYTRQLDVNGVVTPVDLTNATITGKVKAEYSDVATIASFTVTVLDAVNGVFRISLPASVTATLPHGALKYEVRATWPTYVETFFRGNLNVLQGIQ